MLKSKILIISVNRNKILNQKVTYQTTEILSQIDTNNKLLVSKLPKSIWRVDNLVLLEFA